MATLTGWGRDTWSSGAWGEPIPVEVTGVSSTGAVGTVSFSTQQNISVTGVQGTTALGTTVAIGAANVTLTGVSATAALGTATTRTVNSVPVTGVQGVTALGSASVTADSNVYLTGVSATALTREPLVWGLVNTEQDPNWLLIAA